MTLTFDQLTLKIRGTSSVTCSKSVRNLSEIEQSAAELLMILRFFCTHYVALRPWPLTSLSCTFMALRVSCVWTPYQIWANRIIHGWAIDALARLRRAIIGVGQNWQSFLRGVDPTSPNLARHRAIIAALHLCSSVWISCCIFKRGRRKVERCWKRRRISHFLNPYEN